MTSDHKDRKGKARLEPRSDSRFCCSSDCGVDGSFSDGELHRVCGLRRVCDWLGTCSAEVPLSIAFAENS